MEFLMLLIDVIAMVILVKWSVQQESLSADDPPAVAAAARKPGRR
jgi:hypothetical protein